MRIRSLSFLEELSNGTLSSSLSYEVVWVFCVIVSCMGGKVVRRGGEVLIVCTAFEWGEGWCGRLDVDMLWGGELRLGKSWGEAARVGEVGWEVLDSSDIDAAGVTLPSFSVGYQEALGTVGCGFGLLFCLFSCENWRGFLHRSRVLRLVDSRVVGHRSGVDIIEYGERGEERGRSCRVESTVGLGVVNETVRIISITKEQQQALDDALVPREQRLTIGSCNYRLSTTFKPNEPTFQVALDEFWATFSYHKHHIRFKMNKKSYSFNMETFRAASECIKTSLDSRGAPLSLENIGYIINRVYQWVGYRIDTLRFIPRAQRFRIVYQAIVAMFILIFRRSRRRISLRARAEVEMRQDQSDYDPLLSSGFWDLE
ncbi:hypothetical protein Tco_0807511 [Tanacetum coccineum]